VAKETTDAAAAAVVAAPMLLLLLLPTATTMTMRARVASSPTPTPTRSLARQKRVSVEKVGKCWEGFKTRVHAKKYKCTLKKRTNYSNTFSYSWLFLYSVSSIVTLYTTFQKENRHPMYAWLTTETNL
jgi:hypothetical protein